MLKEWIRGGGTLVTLAEATRWATGENVGLLDTKPLLKNGNLDKPGDTKAPGMPATGAGSGGGPKPADSAPSEGAKPTEGAASARPADAGAGKPAAAGAAARPAAERPRLLPRLLPRSSTTTRRSSPIASARTRSRAPSCGSSSTPSTGCRPARTRKRRPSSRAIGCSRRSKLNSGRNVGIYAKKDRLIASGLIWPENQDLLVQKAFAMHQPTGQGHVIAFAEDANYRAFSEGTMLLFMNAVLLGPGY